MRLFLDAPSVAHDASGRRWLRVRLAPRVSREQLGAGLARRWLPATEAADGRLVPDLWNRLPGEPGPTYSRAD